MVSNMLSSLAACCLASLEERIFSWRKSATSRAFFSLSTATTGSPASGVPSSPSTSTGMLGPASLICCPFSSSMARTRPYCRPANTMSPCLSVPCWINSEATAPRPLSSRDSITMPDAGTSDGAVSSSNSDWSSRDSNNSSTPCPVCAETGMNCVSPPQSSGMTSLAASSFFTRSGSAPSLSILLTATTIGTSAARAC